MKAILIDEKLMDREFENVLKEIKARKFEECISSPEYEEAFRRLVKCVTFQILTMKDRLKESTV